MLPELTALVEQSQIYPFLRDRDTDVLEAQDELAGKLDDLLEGMKDSNPDLYEAYATLREFREYLIDDILERTYQDVATDTRTSVEQHKDDPSAPAWVSADTNKPDTALQNPKAKPLMETLSPSPKPLSKLPGRATRRR